MKRKNDIQEEKEVMLMRIKHAEMYLTREDLLLAKQKKEVTSLKRRIADRRREHLRQRKFDRQKILSMMKIHKQPAPLLVDDLNLEDKPMHLTKLWDWGLSRPSVSYPKKMVASSYLHEKYIFDKKPRDTSETLYVSSTPTKEDPGRGTMTKINYRNASFCVVKEKIDQSSFQNQSQPTLHHRHSSFYANF